MTLKIGTRLGPYEITAILGAGGMGEVYRARDARLDRTVAIKVLSEPLANDADARQRFEREARAVSGLSHPHICSLYDIGQQEGVYYLVLEHLEGQTLAERLGSGPLPWKDALRYAGEIADALDTAHQQGVIHRDLKPGNIMITSAGAKLLDFGLAKSTKADAVLAEPSAAPTRTTPLTAEGSLLGTFHYMSPEELEGKPADARSDIFAFGNVLYEMVTGRRAFEGASKARLIASILTQRPRSIGETFPLAPRLLDRVVEACLAKNPEDRYQSMRDVRLHLQWLADPKNDVDPSAASTRRSGLRARTPWTLAALATVVAAVLGILLLTHRSEEPRVLRALLAPPPGTSLNVSSLNPGPPTLSPDGARVVFAAQSADGVIRLWLRGLDSLEATPLVGTEGAGYPFWSPDGRSLGFFVSEKLMRLDIDVGRPVELCDAPIGKGGTWNRDGVILFAPTFNSGIYSVSDKGRASTPVTTLDDPGTFHSHRFPQFLPGGRSFLYLDARPEHSESRIMMGSLDGAPSREIFHAETNGVYASRHILYMDGESLLARPFDPAHPESIGDPLRVAAGVSSLSGAWRGLFTVSERGELVYVPFVDSGPTELTWLDRSGEKLGVLTEVASMSSDSLSIGSLSPDGHQFATSIRDAPGQQADIWLYDVGTGDKTRLTYGINPGPPIWSPDGSRLAFYATVQGTPGLFMKALVGSEPNRLPIDVPPGMLLSWSPDARFIAQVQAGQDTGADIWMLPTSGDQAPYPYLQTPSLEGGAQFSPDGRWIAYWSNTTGSFEVYVSPFEDPGSKWQISTRGGQSPRWREDGKEIFYLAPGNLLIAAQVDIRGGAVRVTGSKTLFPVSQATSDLFAGFLVLENGQRFLVPENVGPEDPAAGSLVLVSDWTIGLNR